MDISQPLSRQPLGFRSWLDMFYLCLDDFVWCIKQQQKIIFGKVGLSDVIDSSESSIIPTDLKARIEEVSKFREHFNVGRFSFNRDGTRRGSFRSRGARGSPRFYHSNRGFNRSRLGTSSYPLSSERSRSPRRESFSNWSSGASRGRGRGRDMVLDKVWSAERGETLRYALSSSPVGARLQKFYREWHALGSDWASSIIRGYRIPLMGRPFIPKGLPEFYGSTDQYALIDNHVQELLEKEAILPVSIQEGSVGFTSPLLLVKKKSGKFYPCLDLRHINANIPYKKFQLEGIKQLKHMLRKGDFMTSIDLQDGYLHVPIAEESQNLLQFR